MATSTFLTLPKATQVSLAKISASVEGVIPDEVAAWEIDVATLPTDPSELAMLQEVSAWAGKCKACLYFFECITPEVDLTVVELEFSAAKAHKENDRAYPRLNAKSTCLYVGSSQAVAKRLAEHLGYRAKKTYAMQLLHWARPLGIRVKITCAKYPDSTPYPVLQALEDTLWESMGPMFGRQGRK